MLQNGLPPLLNFLATRLFPGLECMSQVIVRHAQIILIYFILFANTCKIAIGVFPAVFNLPSTRHMAGTRKNCVHSPPTPARHAQCAEQTNDIGNDHNDKTTGEYNCRRFSRCIGTP